MVAGGKPLRLVALLDGSATRFVVFGLSRVRIDPLPQQAELRMPDAGNLIVEFNWSSTSRLAKGLGLKAPRDQRSQGFRFGRRFAILQA
jgi:hypothetical protein